MVQQSSPRGSAPVQTLCKLLCASQLVMFSWPWKVIAWPAWIQRVEIQVTYFDGMGRLCDHLELDHCMFLLALLYFCNQEGKHFSQVELAHQVKGVCNISGSTLRDGTLPFAFSHVYHRQRSFLQVESAPRAWMPVGWHVQHNLIHRGEGLSPVSSAA